MKSTKRICTPHCLRRDSHFGGDETEMETGVDVQVVEHSEGGWWNELRPRRCSYTGQIRGLNPFQCMSGFKFGMDSTGTRLVKAEVVHTPKVFMIF